MGLILTLPLTGHGASPSLSLFASWEKEDDYHCPSKTGGRINGSGWDLQLRVCAKPCSENESQATDWEKNL